MGGVLILAAILFAGVLWLDFSSPFPWILIATLIWFGMMGWLDDYLKLRKKNHRGLTSKQKLFLQALLLSY